MVLVLALQLLMVHVHKVLVSLPGRAIASALKILQVCVCGGAWYAWYGLLAIYMYAG